MREQTRKPGQPFELSDEELLVAPVRMLDAAQRRRRRQLKNNVAKQKTRKARLDRVARGGVKIGKCQGYTKKGDPCEAYAITGAKHCGSHLNDAEKVKLGRPALYEQAKGKRTGPVERVGNAPRMMKQIVEAAAEKLMQRYFKSLGMEFVGFDQDDNVIIIDHGVQKGICIHGESKDGYIEMSSYPDMAAQVQIMEKLMDRVYGKPKQTQVLEGGDKPIQVTPVRTVERSQNMAALLHRVGAIPHEGRARRDTNTHDSDGTPVRTGETSNVRPLRGESVKDE